MSRLFIAVPAVLLAVAGSAFAADAKLSVKASDTPPPKELSEPVRALLQPKGFTVSDAAGKVVCTLWPRKSLDLKASDPAAAKYTNMEESTIFAAVQFPAVWLDYRKQKVKPGVYTLRFAVQPMDGDHMGTAPYNEFGLLVPAAKDPKPDAIEAKELVDLSSEANGGKHASMMLLFPNRKPEAGPKIEEKPQDHVVLSYQVPVNAGGKSGHLGFSVVVHGHSKAE